MSVRHSRGMLDLEWDVLCPSCRGPSRRVGSLSDLEHDSYCPSCDVRYNTNFDESIEVRFNVNPSIRTAVDVSYCIGGPANTPHIVAQIALPAQGRRMVKLRLTPDRYRLRSRQMTGRVAFEVVSAAAAQTAHVVFDADSASIDESLIGAGEVTIVIDNGADTPALIVIERSDWSTQATSAALATSLTEFRQLFSSEAFVTGGGHRRSESNVSVQRPERFDRTLRTNWRLASLCTGTRPFHPDERNYWRP